MGKKLFLHLSIPLMIAIFSTCTICSAAQQVKISVFNFGTVNLEASGYGTTVTNMLMNSLGAESSLALLDRRELESFLSLNDLQQNDSLDNVVTIGSRLGLEMIVVGSVEKKGAVIIINCKVIQIDQKKFILNTQRRALGDAGLVSEIRSLSALINSTITTQAFSQIGEEKPKLKEPINIQKRSGSKRVNLSWEDPADNNAVGYEIFRSTAESGPFSKVANVNSPEFTDQNIERNTTYYYKIRSYNNKGIQSDFTPVVSAETALTPNPPVILKAEGHIKSIQLTWSPNPISSEDPLRMKGYKLYRAKVEQGPYREVTNILGKDLGIGVDATTTLDKLFKVTYLSRGLADGEDYYYRLTAYNEKNLESEFSLPVKGTTIPPVSGISAQGDMIREIRLTWNAIDSPFIKGYYIYRSTETNGDFTKIKKIDSGNDRKITYVDKEGLGDKVHYFYRITALEDSDTETSSSVTVSAITKGKPPVPGNLKAVSGLVKKIELIWAASPQEEVEGYNLYRSQEKYGKYALLKRIDGRANNTFTDGGAFEKLGDSSTYYYTIKSFNKIDVESELSDVVSATTKPRPAKPSGLKGEELKVKAVPLGWLPNPEKDIKEYHVYRASGSEVGGDFFEIAKVEKTSYSDTGLKDGYTYRYKIRALDKDELVSDFSEIINVRTKPKPKSPEGLSVDVQGGNAELSWKPGENITDYVVYEKKFLSLEKIATTKETKFSEAAPPKGKTKTYVVTAVDKDGLESEPSEEINITGK